MRKAIGVISTCVLWVVVSLVGCSGGTKPLEPTPNDDVPPPVDGIEPESLDPDAGMP